jgi:hypothetical protein
MAARLTGKFFKHLAGFTMPLAALGHRFMRARKITKRPAVAGTAVKERLKPAVIDRSREQYVATIATFRKLTNETNAFIEKAQRLLTSHWAQASWSARAEILKTVDWLIRVGTAQSEPQQARVTEAPRI